MNQRSRQPRYLEVLDPEGHDKNSDKGQKPSPRPRFTAGVHCPLPTRRFPKEHRPWIAIRKSTSETPCLAEWRQIEEGDIVVVKRDREPILAGKVDLRAGDASVFWVWLDGGSGCIAVFPYEGTCVSLPRSHRTEATEEPAGESAQTEIIGQPQA
jgi:hypothetical protein